MTDISDTRHHREVSSTLLADSRTVRASAPFVRPGAASALDSLRLSPYEGGLVFLGPTAAPLPAVDALLGSPEVEPVQACGESLSSWTTSPDEILLLSRRISSILRTGQTVAVHLDSHLQDSADPLPGSSWAFVCSRLSRIVVGLADYPAYVAVHGAEMAQGLLEAVGDIEPPALGEIGGGIPVHQISSRSFLSGTPLAVIPSTRAATAVVQAVDWFEARRCMS